MNYTIFDTPVLKSIVRWLSIFIFKVSGWRAEGDLPDVPKFVLIAAPHTSNWDLPLMLSLGFILRAKIYWMGKDALFQKPFGFIMEWLGGIPIDRSRSNDVVKQSIEEFQKSDQLILAVPPSGTRKKVVHWKTGFYYIAKGAEVPIALGYIDYRRKAGGIHRLVYPTGNIESDMALITEFYSTVTGKYPQQMSGAKVAVSD